MSIKRDRDRTSLRRLSDTYWAESIIPIQRRIAELDIRIRAEPSRERRYHLNEKRRALRRVQSELTRTAAYLEQYYDHVGGDAQ